MSVFGYLHCIPVHDRTGATGADDGFTVRAKRHLPGTPRNNKPRIRLQKSASAPNDPAGPPDSSQALCCACKNRL